MNEYSHHGLVESHSKDHSTTDEYTDLSSKVRVKEKSTPCKRHSDMVICTEFLSLSDAFKEKPNRNFDNQILWSLLSSLITELAGPKPNSDEGSDSAGSGAILDSLSRSIFGLSQPKDFNINSDENINDVNNLMLD